MSRHVSHQKAPSAPAPLPRPVSLVAACATVCLLALALSACDRATNNGSVIDADEPAGVPLDGNGSNAGDDADPLPTARWTTPWLRARVGDTATYKIDRERFRWTLIELNDERRIEKQQLVDAPPFLWPEPIIEPLPTASDDPTAPPWWFAPREANLEPSPIELDSGATVATFAVTFAAYGEIGEPRTFVVSEEVPFDGVVRIEVGADRRVMRELLSFTRADDD